MGSLHLNVTPFSGMRYFSPYLGGFVEAGWFFSEHKVDGDWEDEDYDKNGRQFLYGVGATAGINVLPFSKFSIFAECNLHLYFNRIERSEYYMPGGFMGAPQRKSEKINLSGMSFGGGIKYYFD